MGLSRFLFAELKSKLELLLFVCDCFLEFLEFDLQFIEGNLFFDEFMFARCEVFLSGEESLLGELDAIVAEGKIFLVSCERFFYLEEFFVG